MTLIPIGLIGNLTPRGAAGAALRVRDGGGGGGGAAADPGSG